MPLVLQDVSGGTVDLPDVNVIGNVGQVGFDGVPRNGNDVATVSHSGHGPSCGFKITFPQFPQFTYESVRSRAIAMPQAKAERREVRVYLISNELLHRSKAGHVHQHRVVLALLSSRASSGATEHKCVDCFPEGQ